MKSPFSGLVVPMITPFDASGKPDPERAIRFGSDLLSNGANGLALFGTTSEGQSLSVLERIKLLDAMIAGGIEPADLMVGTGSCALPDAVAMTKHVVNQKCGGILLLPPYFYKAITDEGIFQFVAELIEQVGNQELRIYLYHIPPVAQVGFSVDLVASLQERFPEQIVGVKNSSGSHDYSISLRERCPSMDVFCGSEDYLLDTMRIGGMGCISATGNANPRGIIELYRNVDGANAERLQGSISAIRAIFQARPMIPALKSIVARYYGDSEWLNARPPLGKLTEKERETLESELTASGYSWESLILNDSSTLP